jgi:hypothetical protein
MTDVEQLVECPGCGGLIDLDELVTDTATLRIVVATPVQLEWEPTTDGWLRATCAMIQFISEDVPGEPRLVVHECKRNGPDGDPPGVAGGATANPPRRR